MSTIDFGGIDADGEGPTIGGVTEYRIARDAVTADTPASFDGIEIAGCMERDGVVERVADDRFARFYSVYLHYVECGVECVGDFASSARAHAYAGQIHDAFGWPIKLA